MNYAAIVRIIMSHLDGFLKIINQNLCINNNRFFWKGRNNKVDSFFNSAYFCLHSNLWGIHANKNKNTQKIRDFQFAFRTGKSSFISKQLFFRQSRSSSGKVRNVTLCNGRWGFQERSGRTFWCLSSHFLRSRSSFCTCWVSRFTTAATRPQRSSQARYKCHGFYRELSCREQKIEYQSTYRLNKDPFQHFRTFPQRRKGNCSQKKIPQEESLIKLPDNAVNLYESLRTQVLEGAVRPQGLCVFLYHGMVRGLQILAGKLSASSLSVSSPSLIEKTESPLPSIPLDTELVRLLANMVSHLQPEANYVY